MPGLPRNFCAVLLAVLCMAVPSVGYSADFSAGSLIIPMDTDYQDDGMLKAFGLVHRLLSNGILVHQVIAPGKAQGGVDFTASAVDIQTAAVITGHGYRGGPFVIEAISAPAALTVIADWHAAGHVTSVHETTSPFSGVVARTLQYPPRIAVFANGNELIAFGYLNAAGIPDSLGQPWPVTVDTTRQYPGYPDILNASEIAGASAVGGSDGALVRSDQSPAYCRLVSMPWSTTFDSEVVREVRLWLNWGPEAHLYLQSTAITVFENASSGVFLTTGGLRDDGGTPNPLKFWTPDRPDAQFDGPFTGDAGTVNSIGLVAGSAFKPNVSVMIEEDRGQTNLNQIQMLYLGGYLDGNTVKGQVTCMGGHNYSTTLPISANPQTNGVRLFLNAMLDPPCEHSQPVSVGDGPARPAGFSIKIWSAPEPFGERTRIGYVLPEPGQVDVGVFDVRGRRVRVLVSRQQDAGLHEIEWDAHLESGRRASSGVYWVRVRTPVASGAKRISLLR